MLAHEGVDAATPQYGTLGERHDAVEPTLAFNGIIGRKSCGAAHYRMNDRHFAESKSAICRRIKPQQLALMRQLADCGSLVLCVFVAQTSDHVLEGPDASNRT